LLDLLDENLLDLLDKNVWVLPILNFQAWCLITGGAQAFVITCGIIKGAINSDAVIKC
jgi:hypothetical protein